MNKIIYGLGILGLILCASCGDDDTESAQAARPHAEVYPEDLVKIEDYLKAHYLEITDEDSDGEVDMVEIKIDSLDATHTVSIWDQQGYPLQSKIVKLYGVDFKVYYLKFDGKEDTDAEGDKPCGADRVGVSYEGSLLDGYQFDYAPNLTEFNLTEVVKGWGYVMSWFRAGYFDPISDDGTLNPRNFGSGVMFLPSGLAYYNQGFGNIPAYAPLVFKFNLFSVTRLDQDSDKIESQYEYEFDENGNLLDADSDGYANVFDTDDDNDGYLTSKEIEYTLGGNKYYYPYNGAAVDDPSTPVDETKGIPTCGGTPDYTTPTRLRKHLDKNCH